jgi:outer membrane protein assembly factor BamB
MNKYFYLPVLISAALLSSCDKAKEPLVGDRIEVFDELVITRSEMTREIMMPTPINITSWPMSGGNSYHHTQPALVGQLDSVKELWRVSLSGGSGRDSRIINGPIIADGHVFAVDAYGEVSAVDLETGEIKWTFRAFESGSDTQSFGGGVAYENGSVYITTSSAEIVAVNAKTGEELWRKSVNAPIRSAPTVSDGRLYVTTINNQLDVLSCKDGSFIWGHSGIMEIAGILGGSSVAVKDGIVIAPYSSGEVFALRQDFGHPLWSDSLAAMKAVDSVSALAHIKARPVIYEGKALVVSHSGRTSLHDLRTGSVAWSKDIGGIRTPAIAGATIFMISNDNVIFALDFYSGKIIWTKKLPSRRDMSSKGEKIIWAGPLIVSDKLVFGGSNGKIVFCSSKDGSIVRIIDSGSSLMTSPVIANGTMVFLTDSGELVAYR